MHYLIDASGAFHICLFYYYIFNWCESCESCVPKRQWSVFMSTTYEMGVEVGYLNLKIQWKCYASSMRQVGFRLKIIEININFLFSSCHLFWIISLQFQFNEIVWPTETKTSLETFHSKFELVSYSLSSIHHLLSAACSLCKYERKNRLRELHTVSINMCTKLGDLVFSQSHFPLKIFLFSLRDNWVLFDIFNIYCTAKKFLHSCKLVYCKIFACARYLQKWVCELD